MSHFTKGFQTHPFFQSSQYLCELRILCSFLKAVCGCSLAKSCLTICEPMDCSLPGSSVRGISQARIQEWVAISFSRESSWSRDQTHVSCVGKWILYHWATREAHKDCRLCWINGGLEDSFWCHLTDVLMYLGNLVPAPRLWLLVSEARAGSALGEGWWWRMAWVWLIFAPSALLSNNRLFDYIRWHHYCQSRDEVQNILPKNIW